MMRFLPTSALGLLFALAMLLGLVACGTDPAVTPSAPEVGQPPDIPPVVDQPGIYELGQGEVRVVGILAQLEESGSWGVFGVLDTVAAESFLVAELRGVESLGIDLATYRGRYVSARGVLANETRPPDGAPVVEASALEVIVEDDPADPVP